MLIDEWWLQKTKRLETILVKISRVLKGFLIVLYNICGFIYCLYVFLDVVFLFVSPY